MKDKLEDYQMVAIEKLVPYEQNTKMHSRIQIQKIASSIENYGFDVPIVVDENFMILKGHGRHAALKHLGRKEVPVIMREGLSEAEKKVLALSDNKLAEAPWDPKVLIAEILDLEGFADVKDLGFDRKSLDKIAPDDMLQEITGFEPIIDKKKNRETYREENMHNENGERNPFYGESSMVAPLEDESLYDLNLVDFANWHEDIIVGFSSGKDSMASAIWCFEHLPKEKVHLIFANPGYRVEWPQTIAYVDYANDFFQKKYGWEEEIVVTGGNDTSGLEDMLLQRGFPIPHMCYVQAQLKLDGMKAEETKRGWRDATRKVVKIIAIRWGESKNREREYPQRGKMTDAPYNFMSPIIDWTGEETAKYVYKAGAKLNPLYQFSPRAGCMLCPSSTPIDVYWIKKKYPESYRVIMKWHGMSARKKNLFSRFVDKFLVLPDEINEEALKKHSPYKKYSMTDEELVVELERIRGEKLPRPYFI